jgi:hypothetical protein
MLPDGILDENAGFEFQYWCDMQHRSRTASHSSKNADIGDRCPGAPATGAWSNFVNNEREPLIEGVDSTSPVWGDWTPNFINLSNLGSGSRSDKLSAELGTAQEENRNLKEQLSRLQRHLRDRYSLD